MLLINLILPRKNVITLEHSMFSAVDTWYGIGHFFKYDRDDQKPDFGDGNFYKLVCGGFV